MAGRYYNPRYRNVVPYAVKTKEGYQLRYPKPKRRVKIEAKKHPGYLMLGIGVLGVFIWLLSTRKPDAT